MPLVVLVQLHEDHHEADELDGVQGEAHRDGHLQQGCQVVISISRGSDKKKCSTDLVPDGVPLGLARPQVPHVAASLGDRSYMTSGKFCIILTLHNLPHFLLICLNFLLFGCKIVVGPTLGLCVLCT